MFPTISNLQVQKLGNSLIFMADNVGEFNKTKALKLLFLLEESSVKKYGQPMLGFPFHIWQYGPVLTDVYVDLNEEAPNLLGEFIGRKKLDGAIFESRKPFNDDYFSENEIDLLHDITKFAKHKTAKDLVEITHQPGSLWYTTAQRNDILNALQNKQMPTTDLLIDFSILFENDLIRKEQYLEEQENFEFIHQLKN